MIYENIFVPLTDEEDKIGEYDSDTLLGMLNSDKLKPFGTYISPNRTVKSKLIESILLKYPQLFEIIIKPIKPYKDKKYMIVSGYQELMTINDFINDKFQLSGLSLLDKLNGFKFSDLPEMTKLSFRTSILRVVRLDEKVDAETAEDIYERLQR